MAQIDSSRDSGKNGSGNQESTPASIERWDSGDVREQVNPFPAPDIGCGETAAHGAHFCVLPQHGSEIPHKWDFEADPEADTLVDAPIVPAVGVDFIIPSMAAKKPRLPLSFSTPSLSEKADIAFNWAASFTPTGRPEGTTHRQRAVTIGSAARYLNRTFLLDAIANQCREIVCRSTTTIVKASLQDKDPAVASEMLGWVCYDERTLYYVYVTERARHEGIGTRLLEYIEKIGSLPVACMTAGGAGLLNSISRKWWLPTR